MAMNRETKRMLHRQGSLTDEGLPTRERRQAPAARPQVKEKRATPRQFWREMTGELRKVAWPTRSEVVNYSIVVLVAVVLFTALVAGFDYVFGEFILVLFNA